MGLHETGARRFLATVRWLRAVHRQVTSNRRIQWSSSWEETKVYAKLSFIFLITLAALIFILSNTHEVPYQLPVVEVGSALGMVADSLGRTGRYRSFSDRQSDQLHPAGCETDSGAEKGPKRQHTGR